MEWIQLSILIVFCLAAVVFLFVPTHKRNNHSSQLNINTISFDQIEYLVLLVSTSRPKSKPTKDLLQYKIIDTILQKESKSCRKIILIAGGPEDGAGSSVKNARNIRARATSFTNDDVEVDIKDVLKINDPHETFEKVQSALRDIELETQASGKSFCDFTGGNKMMSLGMAFATIGKAKLVYCIDNPDGLGPSHYIEINAAEVFEEASEDIE